MNASSRAGPAGTALFVVALVINVMNAISKPAPGRWIAITDNLPATIVEGAS